MTCHNLLYPNSLAFVTVITCSCFVVPSKTNYDTFARHKKAHI